MNLDTAIRISAQVQGANNIRSMAAQFQQLNAAAQLSGRQLDKLYTETQRFAAAAGGSINALRQQRQALMTLRDAADPAGRRFQMLGRDIDAVDAKLRRLEGAAQGVGATLKDRLVSGLATAGLGRLTAGMVGVAANFDREVRKAAAIGGEAGSYGVLRKEIEAVAAAAAGTPTEVAKLAVSLSRAGFTAKETTQALRGIVQGAEATAVTFEEMGSIGADVLRSFGLPIAETTRVVDVLVQAANKSNQGVLDLGESMKYAAPVARSLGVPLEDLAATLGLLANNGIRGSDAGTGLRMGLQRLQIAAGGADSEIADLTRGNLLLSKAMQVLNADILDASGNLKPLDQVLLALRRNLGALDSTNRAILAKALFGTEAGSKFLALINSTDQQIVEMFGNMRNAGGVAAKTQKDMQGFAYALDVLRGNIEIVGNAIGDSFGVVLKPAVDGLNAMVSASQQLPKPLRDIAAGAAAAGIAVGGTVLALNALGGAAAVIGGLRGIAAGMTAAGAASTAAAGGMMAAGAASTAAAGGVKALNVALLLNPWAAAIAGVVALTAAAYKFNKPFRDFVDSIPQRFAAFFDSLGGDVTRALNAASSQADAMQQRFEDALDAIGQRSRHVFQQVGVDLSGLQSASKGVTDAMRTHFGGVFDYIGANASRAALRAVAGLGPLIEALKVIGIDIDKAMVASATYTPPAQKLAAAGVPPTYSDAQGRVYDAATGRLKTPAPVRVAPAAPTLPPAGVAAAPRAAAATASTATAAADKAAQAQEAAADRVADHQRQLQEANAEEARRLAEGEFRARQQMDQVLHEQRMQQLDRERAAQRELAQARMELAIAQAPESDRWILEFRQRLLGIVADSGERILDIQRQISDKQQQIRAAQERLRFERQTAQPRVITTGGGGGGAVPMMMRPGVTTGIVARTGNTGDSTGPHLDARWADRRPITVADLDRYVRVNNRAPSSFGVTSPYGPRSLFGRSFHAGVDVGTPSGSGISLINGARMLRDLGNTGAGGYAIEIQTAQGPMRLLHLQAGSAARPPAAAAPTAATTATTTAAAAAPGALQTVLPPSQVEVQSSKGEVAQLTAELNGLEQQLAALQKVEGPLTGVQMLTEGVRQLEQLNQPMAQLARDAGDRLAFEREYGQLLAGGINPELAREYVTVEQVAAKRAESLQRLRQEAQQLAQHAGLTSEQRSSLERVASLSGEYLQGLQGQTAEIKEQVRQTQELQRLQGLRQDTRIGEGIRAGAEEYLRQIGTMKEATAQLTVQGIRGLEDALVSVATTGKANWQEFAASMLASTARMIIQQMVLRVLLQAVGGIGGGGGGSAAAASFELPSAGFPTSGFGPSFAGGGGTGNGPRAGGLDGRGGYMAVLHPQEVVVDRYDRRQLPGITRQLLADARVREEITRQLSERSTVNVANVDRLATVNRRGGRESSVLNLEGVDRLSTVNRGQRRESSVVNLEGVDRLNTVNRRGGLERSTVNLEGIDRLSTVNRRGGLERSTVNLEGIDRVATVNQGQRRERSSVNLAGIDRVATVNQGQRRERSSVNLAGIDRVATVNQGQRRERSSVNLQGVDRLSTVNRQELRELITEQAANQIRHISRRPAMPSYAGGGYTGNAPRAGGLDGQGGFLAMLHPRETVVDHSRGQAATAPAVINVTINNDSKADVQGTNDHNSRRLAADLAAVIDARLQHHKRPGGLLHGGRR